MDIVQNDEDAECRRNRVGLKPVADRIVEAGRGG